MKPTSILVTYLTATLLGGSVPGTQITSTQLSVAAKAAQETTLSRTDSKEASLYGNWLFGSSHSLPPELTLLDRQAVSTMLNRDELQVLAERHSIDLATLLFARSIHSKQENAELQAIYDAELARQKRRSTAVVGTWTVRPTVLFVPGFLYRNHPETGADFAVQRRHLSSLGIRNQLIETDQAGSVEDNAKQISAVLRMRRDDPVILVSASKAGPEVALALGRLLEPEEARSVAVWINIGGLLGGTPLADQALEPSRRWLARLFLWWNNATSNGVRSLRTSESRQRLTELSLPPNLPIVNLVSVTLSGDVSKRAAGGYRKLRRFGPNDGLALLADQIPPHSRTLLQLGDDHFFTRQNPRAMVLALLHTACHAMELGGKTPRRKQ